MRLFYLLCLSLGCGLCLSVSAETSAKQPPLQNITASALDAHPTEIDSNGDGKTDIWQNFSWNGKLKSAIYDTDFDGKPDEWLSIDDAKKVRLQLIDEAKNLRKRTTENMDESGVTTQIITENEISMDKWELSKRQTYSAAKKNYKVEVFQNGQVKEQSTVPAEVH